MGGVIFFDQRSGPEVIGQVLTALSESLRVRMDFGDITHMDTRTAQKTLPYIDVKHLRNPAMVLS